MRNEVQLISAGKGIIHSETNKENQECKLFQIWISSKDDNLNPRYYKQTLLSDNNNQEIINPLNNKNRLPVNQDIFL